MNNLICLFQIIIMVILVVLTIILIMLEIRQYKLRTTVNILSKHIDNIEKGSTHLTAASQKNTSVNSNVIRSNESNNTGTRKSIVPDLYSMNSQCKTRINDAGTEVNVDTGELKNPTFPPATPSEKPYPISGLKVNVSSHYNSNNPVKLDAISQQDALFILYSDLTVSPAERTLNVYNNASFFNNHDFPMIFDFKNKDGYTLDIMHPLKCLATAKPAVVYRSQNGYLLKEKGILIAEE